MSSSHGEGLCVVPARWPRDEGTAALLLRNYAAYLENGPNGGPCICVAGMEKELDSLASLYGHSQGVLLLAWCGEAAAGCVAVKQVAGRMGSCEMKRLWTEPGFRGMGAGRLLVEAATAWAREQQARVLLLDTQPEAMPEAVRLYRSLGFQETERYNDNPVSGLLFMELRLD